MVLLRQTGSLEQTFGGLLDFLETGFTDAGAGNEYSVPAGVNGARTDCFSQPALHSVPYDSVANPLADYKAKTAVFQAVGQVPEHQEAIGRAAAVTMDLGDAGTTG